MNQNPSKLTAVYSPGSHAYSAPRWTFAVLSLGFVVATSTAPATATPLHSSAIQVAQSTQQPEQAREFPDSCRRTSVQVPIGVRQQPSFNSPLIGTLTRGTRVNIVNLGSNGWVPINAPYQGFVYAGYLTYCGDRFIVPEALITPDN